MASDTEADAVKTISDVGKKLASQKTCPNKDQLVKLLRKAAVALPELKQLESLKPAVKPLSDSLFKHGMLQHKDKDVKLLVANCVCEIIRVLAPNPDFCDSAFRDIFNLIISMFREFSDTKSPYFSSRVKILETVAKVKVCVRMLDTGCEDLVLDMFNIFFSVIREHHPQSLVSSMLSIMVLILKEKVSESLVNVILQNLLKGTQLAVMVIQNCSHDIEPLVCGFLSACILNRDTVGSKLKEFHHELIFQIFQCAPQMLLVVIPNLIQELLTDQVDVRIKALNLIGRLFALPGNQISLEYHQLFIEFLNRFSDKSVEVRLSALQCAKTFCMTNPAGTKSLEDAIKGRLLDFDDRVRIQAISVVCDLARSNLRVFSPELISEAAKRLRDKKVSVRKKALQKLLEAYQDYCVKCSGASIKLCEHFERIPCGILILCYDKDCKEFRLQNMELVLSEDLFPASLSIEERIRHWIFLFSLFRLHHIKALNMILSYKQRLQTEMRIYLGLKKKEEENGSEEVKQMIKMCLVKMSALFPDPTNAEECFEKLDALKDNWIFNALEQLLDEVTIKDAQIARELFLRKLEGEHPHIGFLQLLSTKCLFNIFSSEHVQCIINHLFGGRFESSDWKVPSIKLLMTIIQVFPSLLRGLEEQFCHLLEEEYIPFDEELLQILTKVGSHISIDLSHIYPHLERICLEGKRAQSKLAVSVIAASIDSSRQFLFSALCKKLVASLHIGQNVPAALQSLGWVAQHSVSVFESHEREITQYIVEKILQASDVEIANNIDSRDEIANNVDSRDETSEGSISCRLKICGLKALVKSFLPHNDRHTNRPLDPLFDLLLQILQKGYISGGTIPRESDKAHMRLAAAKSVLQLSKRWDLHISPEIFRRTVLITKDSSHWVRKKFIDKTHKLIMEHVIPIRYACAFALAASDSLEIQQDYPLNYVSEFIKEYSRVGQVHLSSEGREITKHPVYTIVFLIHVLAHDACFPFENCQDVEIFSQFCSPLVFMLKALVNASFIDGDVNLAKTFVSYLLSIFHAIKKADDAVNPNITSNLQKLADFGILMLKAMKHDCVSMSDTLGIILLPSSLYKIGNDERRETTLNYSPEGVTAENISNQMLCRSEYQISQGWEDSSSLDFILCRRTLELSKKVGSDANDTTRKSDSLYEHHEGNEAIVKSVGKNRGRRKLAPSCHPALVRLHKDFSISDNDESGPSDYSEPFIKNDQLLSSCDSLITEPCLVQKENSLQHPLHLPLKEKTNLSNSKIPTAVKRKKGLKISTDTSLSEVIDVNEDAIARRTRRQKVLNYS